MMATIALESPADPETTVLVEDGLMAFNHRHMPRSDPQTFNVVLRDESGAVVGGCLCVTRWHWLYVDMLWVSDSERGHGHGTALLRAAEQEAVKRGCTKAHLDTVSFQARPFYEAQGWRLFGTLDDNPPGHTRYYLQKDLTQTL